MTKTLIVYILLICSGYQHLSAQIISARLQDRETSEPVAFASVFFSNTSIGTTSDSSGFFRLDMNGLREVDLVISHLSYKIRSQKISNPSQLTAIVLLSPRETKLDEVTISADHSPKRKRWIKRFTKSFLGKSAKKNNTTILNPEVLVFSEKGGILEARTLDYLYIKNEALGYNLRFYLKNFLLESNSDVAYTGKVFFEDLQDSTLKKTKLLKAREKTYALSKTHFFESLLNDSLKGTLYHLGETTLSDNWGVASFKNLSFSDLSIKRGIQDDTLFIEDYLTIVDRSTKSFWYVFKGEEKFATSFINSKTGKIILSRNGTILNPKDIEEIGFWAQQRIADLLPLDYKQGEIPPPPSQLLLDSLTQFVQNRPQEKLYLHLNKPYYTLGEEIWLKAYLVDASTHQPRTKSKVIYTELIDPTGKIVDSLMFHTDKGTAGRFALRKQKITGTYQVRAYTQYMRNQPSDFFFQQAIQVYAYAGEGLSQNSSNLAERQLDNHTELTPIQVKFYPEGGELVADLKNRMAYEIHTAPHIAQNLELVIISKQGEIIATNKTTHEGIGILSFVPKTDQEYQARVSYEGNTYTYALPQILPKGYLLQVDNSDEDSLLIKVSISEELNPEEAFLIGHVRGNISLFVEELASEQILRIPKAHLPTGIFHLSLFDNQGRGQAERLVFNQKGLHRDSLGIEVVQASFESGNIDLKFSLKNKIPSVENSSLSVSITDPSLVLYPNYGGNIKNFLYLNSDLSKPIASPNLYLNPYAMELEALDLQLMTRGWRRFIWRDLLKEKEEDPYAAEQGYSITGYVALADDSTKRSKAFVMLNSLDQQLFVEQTETDRDGNFSFKNIPLMDSTLYILQSRTQKESSKKQEISMKGKRTVNVFLTPLPRPGVQIKPYVSSGPPDSLAWQRYVKQEYLEDSLAGLEIDLEEVTITGRSSGTRDSRVFNVYNLDQLDWVPNETPALNLLSMFKASYTYELDRIENKMVMLKNIRGQLTKVPVVFYINGMLRSYIAFQALTADVISYIGFFGSPAGTAIVVQTRPNGRRSLEKELEKGILDYMHPGYDLAREFYKPLSQKSNLANTTSPLQSALYWEPMLKLDTEGNATLSFKEAANAYSYEVRVEGITSTGIPIFETFSFQKKN